MAFCFTVGTHHFSSQIPEAQHITAQCQNCGNFSARVIKDWEWFTFCFIPIIPLSLKPYRDVSCGICNFQQDLKYRPDVQAQMNGQGGQQIPMQGGPQGWGQPQPQQGGYAPPQNHPQPYQQQQQSGMAYK